MVGMSTDILVPPSQGTMVWLHSLKTARWNGQRGLVCQREAASDLCDRCAVELVEGRKVILVKHQNLSLSPLAYFCIKEAPGKGGLGVFATQDISAGVRILSEVPILNLAKRPTRKMESVKDRFASMQYSWALDKSLMSSTQQAALYKLHDCFRGERPPTAAGIINTNSFSLGLGACVFLLASRFNHSCRPNCSHWWNLGRKTINTDRDIKCGEELTLSYLKFERMPQSARQDSLEWKHRFSCDCEVCKLTQDVREASDSRRTMIGVVTDGVTGAFNSHDYRKVVQLVQHKLALLWEEGLLTPSMMFGAEYDAFEACKLQGLHTEARVWLERAHKHCLMSNGAEGQSADVMAKQMAEPVDQEVMKACS